MRILDSSPLLALRSSFRTKLLLGLLGSVAVLAAVTLLVVRSETQRQIELATQQMEQRSREAFLELEAYNRAQLSQLSLVFTGSVQAAAALEGALESGDFETLGDDVDYEFEARLIPHTLVAFTDAYGEPVLARVNRRALSGADPVGVGELAQRLLDDPDATVRGYRSVQDTLFSVETLLLDLGRPVGTVTVGVPITDADAARLGSVLGAEVCFVVDGRCIVGTAGARGPLESAMVALAARQQGAAAAQQDPAAAQQDPAAAQRDPAAAQQDAAAVPSRPQSGLAHADGVRWRIIADRFSGESNAAWRVIGVPLDPVIAPFERVQRALLFGGIGALLLAVLIALLLSRSLTRPVLDLVDATSRIADGDYDVRVAVPGVDEIGVLGHAFNEMAEGLALKQRYRGVLDKVVSREVAEELLKGELVLGGEKREVTIVFGDITDFTGITEGMEPTRVIALLNECMERLSNVVEAEGGVVDKYVGDEIMALFGAPISRPLDALRGVRAALGMQGAMRELSTERVRRGELPFALSIGVNTGVAMAGNMGSANRLNYTVLGDAVNLAARLEQLADGDQILISEHTLRQVEDHVAVRDLGERELRGFSQPVRVYELIGLLESAPAPDAHTKQLATAGGWRGAALLAAALAFGATAAVATPLHAQWSGELPTLERVRYESASGWLQAGLSGRLDLEGYVPQEQPAWIIPSTKTFVAPRLRVFGDAFFGERVMASAELRVDRGEEPAAGPMEVRLDQLFVRAALHPAFAAQAGKFVSPLGGYPQRHHTRDDPFIRPPLHYDYRTVLSAAFAPLTREGLLTWKDRTDEFRPGGAPVIWGAPYQWGAQVMGQLGPRVSWRAAAVNSAPSSEPDEWGLERGFGAPSFIANAGVQLHPALRLELSHNRGPWLREDAERIPAGWSASDYDQRIWLAEAVFTYGRTKLRGEAVHDAWGVPNVGYDVVDISWYVEAEQTVRSAISLAARYGAIHFRDVADPDYAGTGYGGEPWDYDVDRLQLAAGYRFARNGGVRIETAFNGSTAPTAIRDNLTSVQLWWEF